MKSTLSSLEFVRSRFKGEMVPKLAVEEKEQEILAKEETIQVT